MYKNFSLVRAQKSLRVLFPNQKKVILKERERGVQFFFSFLTFLRNFLKQTFDKHLVIYREVFFSSLFFQFKKNKNYRVPPIDEKRNGKYLICEIV